MPFGFPKGFLLYRKLPRFDPAVRETLLNSRALQRWARVNAGNFIFPDEEEMRTAQNVIKTIKKDSPVELIYDGEKKRYTICVRIKGKIYNVGMMNKYFLKGFFPKPARLDGLYVDGVYSFIGDPEGYTERFEREILSSKNSYAKYRIWNYFTFSGPARVHY